MFQRGFTQAGEAAGLIEKRYRIGDFALRLRFAGQALVDQIHPAISHLAVEAIGGAPDLTICLWDGPLPHLLDSLRLLLKRHRCSRVEPRGEVRGYYCDRIRCGIHFDPDSFSLFDLETQTALYWTEDAARLPYYERGSPLRMILSWWLQARGYQYVHGAALGDGVGGALLLGAGGSGKSTAALACLGGDLQYLADDYCAMRVEPSPRLYSLYRTVKLPGPEDIARCSAANPLVSNESFEQSQKTMAFLEPAHLRQETPLKAVVLVSHGDQEQATYARVSGSAVLRQALPWTMLQLPNAGPVTARLFKALAQTVPCYRLTTGTDLTQIPNALRSILGEA